MAISQRLQPRLAQKLILTPALQQVIKLLPMSTLELVDLLNQEVVENPLLEEMTTEDLRQADAAAKVEKAEPDPQPTRDRQDTWDDADYEYFFGEYLDEGYRPRIPREIREHPPIENTLSSTTSLSDHLRWQLPFRTSDERVREIGTTIVGNLDDDGYLDASIEEIAAMGDWSESEVEQALSIVQTLDPVGIAARDLRECLLLQLAHLALDETAADADKPHLEVTTAIVRDHFGLLERHRVPELARCLSISSDEVNQHLAIIRHLDPKPGRRHNPAEPQYVTPDVYVVKVDDQYVAMLNDDRLPQLRISPAYRRLLDKNNEDSAETRSFVKERFRSALWLIKSVDQRQKTIRKVATSIINFQHAFLDYGIERLQPLVLRDVANDIGMHESTVSRVVNNKYMHTPQGVFEMKYFFHSGIHSAFGDSVSSVTIKERIRKMVEKEDPRKPLSDARIVDLLRADGLLLARRTIAKYRSELRIPTSSQRRQIG